VRRRIRATGWGLLAGVLVVAAVVVMVGAFRARGDAAFNRWVGWATIAALAVAVISGVLALWGKVAGAAAEPPDMRITEGELAARVLAEAQDARSRLIGTDVPGDDAASVAFVRRAGFREVGGGTRGDLASVLEYYQSLSPQRLVVLGQAGCGKTVLALELQVRLLKAGERDPGVGVAVLVSAASYDNRQAWKDWLAAHLAQRYGVTTEMMRRLIRDSRILPLVDGLDEMDDPADPPERAQALIDELNTAMRGTERAPVLVTCRDREYQSLLRKLDRAAQVEMLPLTGEEAASYLREQFRTGDELDRWKDVLDGLDGLEGDAGGLLAAQLGTPWRLTLALAAFRDHGDPRTLLRPADTAEHQHAHAVDTRLLDSYVSSAVRLHAAGRYREEEVRSWLSALADGLAWQARRGRSGTDIRLEEWWVADGHLAIRLSHIALASLPALPWLIVSAVTGNAWFLLPAGSVLLLSVITAGGTASAKRLGLKNAITRHGMRALRNNVFVGYAHWLAPGILIGILFWLATGLRGGERLLLLDAVDIGSAMALLVGVPAGINRGLMDAFADSAPHAVQPREVIRADTRFRIAVAVTVGILIGLPAGFVVGLLNGGSIALGVALGAAAGLTAGATAALAGAPNWDPLSDSGTVVIEAAAGGASASTRYYVSVLVGSLRRRGPRRFAEFLDWGQRAGLLRVLGVAYQFRHRQLQDLLTTSDGRK
jgi:hypothetical protein